MPLINSAFSPDTVGNEGSICDEELQPLQQHQQSNQIVVFTSTIIVSFFCILNLFHTKSFLKSITGITFHN